MSAIITRIDPATDLTVHTIEGPITNHDIIHTFEEYFHGETTSAMVWDFSAAEFNGCRDEDVQSIAVAANKQTAFRSGGKTALVLPGDLQFGLGRMFETFAELENDCVQVQSFRSMDDAMAWINAKL
jgi:hypothetical protein